MAPGTIITQTEPANEQIVDDINQLVELINAFSEQVAKRTSEDIEFKGSRSQSRIKPKPKPYQQVHHWWQKYSIQYAFSDMRVKSRLESLMGSGVVPLFDRKYMHRLSLRILEDYVYETCQRVMLREESEFNRIKNLVLLGKMRVGDAPREIAKHPVFIIRRHCAYKVEAWRQQEKEKRRFRIKPRFIYIDDTPEVQRKLTAIQYENICVPPEFHLGNDEDAHYMFDESTFKKLKPDLNPIKEEIENMGDLYDMCDNILGPLKRLEKNENNQEEIKSTGSTDSKEHKKYKY